MANADWSGELETTGLERPFALSRQTQKYVQRSLEMRPLHTRTTFTGRYRGVHRSTPLGSEDFLWKEMTK